MTLLVDTGVLLAYADSSDQDHERCLALLDSESADLLTTALVAAEAGWLVERQLGPHAEAGFYRWVVTGDLLVEQLTIQDWIRVIELTEKYADNGLGGVDSSLVAVAERLGLDTIATLDQRHFRAVRPAHVQAFTIVP
ncbi:MAG: PIN domain-containing protein [Solirubrobacterales bacterium]|nr:PIN domain-containing protein [Solirubrobacterales bacterium]